eukprot:GHVT01007805.1.p1 GENE.GHVT01007805.1~~GHVT01007805.1.p1  ORF type:complete len:119 (+),score=3.01 GHVT01007805.1:334-690(+)
MGSQLFSNVCRLAARISATSQKLSRSSVSPTLLLRGLLSGYTLVLYTAGVSAAWCKYLNLMWWLEEQIHILALFNATLSNRRLLCFSILSSCAAIRSVLFTSIFASVGYPEAVWPLTF